MHETVPATETTTNVISSEPRPAAAPAVTMREWSPDPNEPEAVKSRRLPLRPRLGVPLTPEVRRRFAEQYVSDYRTDKFAEAFPPAGGLGATTTGLTNYLFDKLSSVNLKSALADLLKLLNNKVLGLADNPASWQTPHTVLEYQLQTIRSGPATLQKILELVDQLLSFDLRMAPAPFTVEDVERDIDDLARIFGAVHYAEFTLMPTAPYDRCIYLFIDTGPVNLQFEDIVVEFGPFEIGMRWDIQSRLAGNLRNADEYQYGSALVVIPRAPVLIAGTPQRDVWQRLTVASGRAVVNTTDPTRAMGGMEFSHPYLKGSSICLGVNKPHIESLCKRGLITLAMLGMAEILRIPPGVDSTPYRPLSSWARLYAAPANQAAHQAQPRPAVAAAATGGNTLGQQAFVEAVEAYALRPDFLQWLAGAARDHFAAPAT